MSPPEAPTPPAALGCPAYVRPHAPVVAAPRHSSLPPPSPSSDPRATRPARETWIAGSPAMLVPQPVAPTWLSCSSPTEKVAEPVPPVLVDVGLGVGLTVGLGVAVGLGVGLGVLCGRLP